MGLLTLSVLYLVAGYYSAQSTPTPKCGVSLAAVSRIVNGEIAEHGAYPWMASVQEFIYGKYRHVCGGAVLNENWIVTAAHCFEKPPVDTSTFEVHVGISSIRNEDSTVQRLKVSDIIIHEDYDDDYYTYDIALIKTATKINIKGSEGYVNAVCLPEASSTPTGSATIIGWGVTKNNGTLSPDLREASVPVLSMEDCKDKFENRKVNHFYIKIYDHMLCAGGKGKDTCEGDSGGPLFQIDNGVATLIGTVATGTDCALKDFPGLYMKVSSFRKWIDEHIA